MMFNGLKIVTLLNHLAKHRCVSYFKNRQYTQQFGTGV